MRKSYVDALLKASAMAAFVTVATMLSPLPVSGPLYAAQDAVYQYKTLSFSEANVNAFLGIISSEQAAVMAELGKKYADKPEKVEKHPAALGYQRIHTDLEDLLACMRAGADAQAELAHRFLRLQRLHYSILADREQGVMEPSLKRRLKMLKNVLGKSMALNVPAVADPKAPIGSTAAANESARLYRPGEKVAVSAADLAGMSAVDISRLQPAADHPALSGKLPGDNYAAFLEELTRLIRQCEPKLKSFNFQYARGVVFYDELKQDATSPKIRVKDRYGLTWGLKWGDEVHTDVAMTRLAIDLGASYTDPKFYSGPGETILVLDPPAKKKEDAVKSFAQLAENLLASKFQFHAQRYLLTGKNLVKDSNGQILGHGIVDEAMLERESIDKKYLGAPYVLFKECQLSFFNPAVKRFGGAALSNVGAVQDRVTRSSIIFNTWIKNKDMKDDNSRAALLFNPKTGNFDRTVEFQSDLGCTLGSLKPSGEINSFENSFVKNVAAGIGFSMPVLYIPASWKACSWADARWMALRIASLGRADLERCFADSGWPVFVQRLAIEKLLARRNELIEPFRLDLDGVKPLACDPKLTITVNHQGQEYQPVLNGVIDGNCPLVQQLTGEIHAEGLASVINRKND
ncbi:MAG TPA: hypothetical protein PLM07_08055 [Candidatus Rifleibacterium sp.]|nr:hypothetical protein [Candidatus Rifleibacterium sp.]HPT45837.1 hypothetical protein [Candidatus Rifleibacterium sp.]